jgi:hypothetical protein
VTGFDPSYVLQLGRARGSGRADAGRERGQERGIVAGGEGRSCGSRRLLPTGRGRERGEESI